MLDVAGCNRQSLSRCDRLKVSRCDNELWGDLLAIEASEVTGDGVRHSAGC